MKLDRRNFLGATAGAVILGGAGTRAQQNRIQLGLIGCGWYGMIDAKAALKTGAVSVTAVCDVDTVHLDKAAREIETLQGSRPKTFKDFRELLAQPGLQAVIIATPPHWHALPFIEACRRGLDIYCEKPLAYDIREGQAMFQAARQADNRVQIGFQRRKARSVNEAADFIRSGQAGKILEVEARIHYGAKIGDTRVQEPPPSLDWDFWCGPAPKLPYRPSIGHFNWRLEAAYGNGHLVDWGIHWIDAIRSVLDLGMPGRVQASGGNLFFKNEITTPDSMTAMFEFQQCPVVWRHRIWGAAEDEDRISNGITFFGDKATVFANDSRWMVVPRENPGNRHVYEVKDANAPGEAHVAEFVEAVRAGGRPSCTVLDGFRSTASVQLAMIAFRTGRKISWDSEQLEIQQDDDASRMLKREYRSPWVHPART